MGPFLTFFGGSLTQRKILLKEHSTCRKLNIDQKDHSIQLCTSTKVSLKNPVRIISIIAKNLAVMPENQGLAPNIDIVLKCMNYISEIIFFSRQCLSIVKILIFKVPIFCLPRSICVEPQKVALCSQCSFLSLKSNESRHLRLRGGFS